MKAGFNIFHHLCDRVAETPHCFPVVKYFRSESCSPRCFIHDFSSHSRKDYPTKQTQDICCTQSWNLVYWTQKTGTNYWSGLLVRDGGAHPFAEWSVQWCSSGIHTHDGSMGLAYLPTFTVKNQVNVGWYNNNNNNNNNNIPGPYPICSMGLVYLPTCTIHFM